MTKPDLEDTASTPSEKDSEAEPNTSFPWGFIAIAVLVLFAALCRVLDLETKTINRLLGAAILGVSLLYALCQTIRDLVSFPKRLVELLATICFGCIIPVVAGAIWKLQPAESAFVFALGMAWAIAGSAWAWSNMERFDATTPARRLSCLCRGWISVAPLILIWVAINPNDSAFIRVVFGVLTMLCSIPFVIECFDERGY